MILKEKDAYTGDDDRAFYGHKQEQDVAFHLRREFGESDQIRVINVYSDGIHLTHAPVGSL